MAISLTTTKIEFELGMHLKSDEDVRATRTLIINDPSLADEDFQAAQDFRDWLLETVPGTGSLSAIVPAEFFQPTAGGEGAVYVVDSSQMRVVETTTTYF